MSTTLRVSALGRAAVEQARKGKGWKAQSTSWCAKAHVAMSTLRRFRKGDAVGKDNFIALCQAVGIDNWQALVDDSPLPSKEPRHFYAYDADIWVGRESLLCGLAQKLKDNCRLLIVAGITGIGKTALAERLIIELQSTGHFKNSAVQENLDEQEKSTDFASFAIRILEKCNQPVGPQAQKNPQQLLSQLIQHLKATPKLIVIDSLERLLKGDEHEGWCAFNDKWFVTFFQVLLSTPECQSRLVLTSQELPAQIQCIGNRYQKFWHCEALCGLSEDSRLNLFLKIFSTIELTAQNLDYLKRIGKAYEGHPLALRVIAGEICGKPFCGNIKAYWQKYGCEIEAVERAIVEAQAGEQSGSDDSWQLDRFTQTLRRSVRQRLQHTFDRLQQDAHWAYILLCESSVYRLPVSEKWWMNHLDYWDVPDHERPLALDALRDRYLLEELVKDDRHMVRQHNLIRSVALEHLQRLGE